MNIGILVINSGEAVSDCKSFVNINDIAQELASRGHFVTDTIFSCNKDKILKAFEYLKISNEVLLILGKIEDFFDALTQKFVLNSTQSVLDIDGVTCVLSKEYSEKFLQDVFLPLLLSKNSTNYSSYIFKTFGKTEEELREILKDYIKNRNKIFFKFVSRPMECDILIRYSNKTAKDAINELIAGVTMALSDYIYSLENKSLSQTVAELLMLRGKKIKIAESFTGGGVASALVKYSGISACLKESIVCYSNESKIARLKVDPKIIERYGAVSIETAYEMAANLLMSGGCDLSVATTGNAGPTSEKPDQQGLCFIAVGDASGVNLYNYYFVGDRQYVTDCGVKSALFRLYQILTQDEFKTLLAQNA